MSHQKRRAGWNDAQKQYLRQRGEQGRTLASMLFRAFAGTPKEQREVFDAVVEDGTEQLRERRAVDEDEAIVVHGELVEPEEDDP
jgi:hypothetical protein